MCHIKKTKIRLLDNKIYFTYTSIIHTTELFGTQTFTVMLLYKHYYFYHASACQCMQSTILLWQICQSVCPSHVDIDLIHSIRSNNQILHRDQTTCEENFTWPVVCLWSLTFLVTVTQTLNEIYAVADNYLQECLKAAHSCRNVSGLHK